MTSKVRRSFWFSTRVKNSRGQATIEMVMLFALVSGIWILVTTSLAKSGSYQAMFGDPWLRLKNTIEFGVPSDQANLAGKHPAHGDRHSIRVTPR